MENTDAVSRLQEYGMTWVFVIWKGFARMWWKGSKDMSALSYLGHDTIHNVAFSVFFNLAYVYYTMKYKIPVRIFLFKAG